MAFPAPSGAAGAAASAALTASAGVANLAALLTQLGLKPADAISQLEALGRGGPPATVELGKLRLAGD
eukprot:4798133-Prymnesium_polylepis.1